MNLRPSSVPASLLPTAALASPCASCRSRHVCLAMGLGGEAQTRLAAIIGPRRRVTAGESLYRHNDAFLYLYAIRLGQFKTISGTRAGAEQVTGFHMNGDLLALDALGGDRHPCGAVALEDSEVCEIPIGPLETLLGDVPALMSHFHRRLSGEIQRRQNGMALLGKMAAEQRLAVFLTELSALGASRGYSATDLRLRMSREDISNYLGMTVENVSRMLLRLKQRGWIDVDLKSITLRESVLIQNYASGGSEGTTKNRPQTVIAAVRAISPSHPLGLDLPQGF